MGWKINFGIGLIFVSLFIILTGGVITGAVIGFQPQNYLGLFGLLIFVVGIFLIVIERLEDKLGRRSYETHQQAHNAANYQRLKDRLLEMQRLKIQGVSPETPTGRYLSENEEQNIYNIIWQNLPDEIKKSKDLEISISGSLSRHKERRGKRQAGKFEIEEPLESDQFYLSDVDISIAGRNAFDYIESKWGSAVIKGGNKKGQGGQLKDIATYKISNQEYLNRRENELGYMQEAPSWMKNILRGLSQYHFAGEKRPVNIKFFKNQETIRDKPRDILYKS